MLAQAGLALVLAIGIAAAGAGVYLEGKRAGRDACQATDAREREIGREAAAVAASVAASAIAGIKVQNRTIHTEVQREVQTNTVYRDCRHSPEQLQRINAALTDEQPEPAGRGLVPHADPPGR